MADELLDEGPAELVFVHGGHGDGVNDLSWNPNVGLRVEFYCRMKERLHLLQKMVHCRYGTLLIRFLGRVIVVFELFVTKFFFGLF